MRLISEVENTVTQELEAGDRTRAMKRLRVPPLGEKQTPWTTFKVGLYSGSFMVLFCTVVLSGMLLYKYIIGDVPTDHLCVLCVFRESRKDEDRAVR